MLLPREYARAAKIALESIVDDDIELQFWILLRSIAEQGKLRRAGLPRVLRFRFKRAFLFFLVLLRFCLDLDDGGMHSKEAWV